MRGLYANKSLSSAFWSLRRCLRPVSISPSFWILSWIYFRIISESQRFAVNILKFLKTLKYSKEKDVCPVRKWCHPECPSCHPRRLSCHPESATVLGGRRISSNRDSHSTSLRASLFHGVYPELILGVQNDKLNKLNRLVFGNGTAAKKIVSKLKWKFPRSLMVMSNVKL